MAREDGAGRCHVGVPAVIHCVSPSPNRPAHPIESLWSTWNTRCQAGSADTHKNTHTIRTSPWRATVTVSKPRWGCIGKPGTESPWYLPIVHAHGEIEAPPGVFRHGNIHAARTCSSLCCQSRCRCGGRVCWHQWTCPPCRVDTCPGGTLAKPTRQVLQVTNTSGTAPHPPHTHTYQQTRKGTVWPLACSTRMRA